MKKYCDLACSNILAILPAILPVIVLHPLPRIMTQKINALPAHSLIEKILNLRRLLFYSIQFFWCRCSSRGIISALDILHICLYTIGRHAYRCSLLIRKTLPRRRNPKTYQVTRRWWRSCRMHLLRLSWRIWKCKIPRPGHQYLSHSAQDVRISLKAPRTSGSLSYSLHLECPFFDCTGG